MELTSNALYNSSINTDDAYGESISYDVNGNILSYLRKGANSTAGPLEMDDLSYPYHRDGSGNLVNNHYDNIGNLTNDVAECINSINLAMYDRIRSFDKSTGPDLSYQYDAAGNRIVKEVNDGTNTTKTFYIRDAQGDVLAVYSKKNSEAVKWNEQHLYGSSRLGMWQWGEALTAAPPNVQNSDIHDHYLYGTRTYDLSNHLGNVLATITDKKIGVPSPSNSSLTGHFEADVVSAQDYYPFGMQMPGRKFNTGAYRYGFNGKENDNEVKGEGNQQDYGFRIYDPRVGRFLSFDPLANNFPWNSPYSYAEGNPINYEDLDGLETPTTRNAARIRPSRPALSNTVVDRNGRIVPAPVGANSAPIIPPNAGAYRVPGGWFIETPNGGYTVHDENPFGPQPAAPQIDMRSQGEKDADAGKMAFYYFKRDINGDKSTPTNSFSIITTDARNLPDWYVQDVKARLLNGKGSFNDWIYKDELVRRGVLSTRFGQAQEFGKGASGDVLGRNLERAGQVRLNVNHAAHHIVAGGDSRGAGARKILAKEGIDVNDADNGVFLETGSHRGIHTNNYYRKIETRLRSAGTGNVRKELNQIRTEIKSGTF